MIEKITEYIKTQWPTTLLILLATVCCWAIFAIELQVAPLIPSLWSAEFASNLNRVIINLAYSYFAGCIFYLLTIVVPFQIKKSKVKKPIEVRIKEIINSIENITLEFSRDTNIKHKNFEENACRQMLESKQWDQEMPMFKRLYRVSANHFKHIAMEGNVLKSNVDTLIDLYKDYLTAEQIVAFETLRTAVIWNMAKQFSDINITMGCPRGQKDLVDKFIIVIKTAVKIEALFNIKRETYETII